MGLCIQCKETEVERGRLKCDACMKSNKIARMKRNNATAKAKRDARPPKPPLLRLCKCGCGNMATSPSHYATDACRAKSREASRAKWNRTRKKPEPEAKPAKADHPERFGLKPHRPAKVITLSKEESDALDAEQERLNAEASAADRAWHAQFMKDTLGLESAPGQPLASKVVRPPKEVWRELEAAYRPQGSHEREIFIPARADISY